MTPGRRRNWGDPSWVFSRGVFLGVGREVGGTCKGGDAVLPSGPAAERVAVEILVSGDPGPQGERLTAGERSGALRSRAACGGRRRAAGGRVRSSGRGAGRAVSGGSYRRQFPRGRPAAVWEGKLDRVGLERAMRQRCAGSELGGDRGGAAGPGLGSLSTKGPLKLPPGVKEEKARKKRIRSFFKEWKMFPG